MNFLNTFLAFAADEATATGPELQGAAGWIQILPLVIMFGLMYLFLIVPQRRKDKKQREIINSAVVGDQIVTIGGMVGKIVNIKDDEVTFESSVERTKITIKKWAIKEVIKPTEA